MSSLEKFQSYNLLERLEIGAVTILVGIALFALAYCCVKFLIPRTTGKAKYLSITLCIMFVIGGLFILWTKIHFIAFFAIIAFLFYCYISSQKSY